MSSTRIRVRIVFLVLTSVVLTLTLLLFHRVAIFERGYSNLEEKNKLNATSVRTIKCKQTLDQNVTTQMNKMEHTLTTENSLRRPFLKHSVNESKTSPKSTNNSSFGAINSSIPAVNSSLIITKKLPKKMKKANKTVAHLNSYSTQRLNIYPGFVPTLWTFAGGKVEADSFQLFSAYYDSRNVSNSVEAVLVLGYALNKVRKRPLYCEFKYEDNDTECVKKPLVMQSIASCYTVSRLGGVPYFFRCDVGHHYRVPLTVRISDSSTCTSQFTSDEILIRNRNVSKSVKSEFGICVGGPLVGQNSTLQDVIEFISINQILGAKLITIYIIIERVKASVIEYLLSRYPKVLRVIEWKNLSKWYPLHYYGQYLIIQDCLYRSMYEVNYLFLQDIDEVIIPAEGKHWSEMVKKLPNSGVGFRFRNFFFTSGPIITPVSTALKNSFSKERCNNLEVPKYLTRTLRHVCFPNYNYRVKLMVRPRFVVDVAIHWACKVLDGYNKSIDVPVNVGFLGHYRNLIAEDCLKHEVKPVMEYLWATKYSDLLREKICLH